MRMPTGITGSTNLTPQELCELQRLVAAVSRPVPVLCQNLSH